MEKKRTGQLVLPVSGMFPKCIREVSIQQNGHNLLPYFHGLLIVMPKKVVGFVRFDSLSTVHTQIKHCKSNRVMSTKAMQVFHLHHTNQSDKEHDSKGYMQDVSPHSCRHKSSLLSFHFFCDTE